jgi:hypothetical protein
MRPQLFKKLKQEAEFWLGRRLPTCQEVLPVLSESLERRLTAREYVTLKLHFIICTYCVRYLRHLRFMREAMRMQSARIAEAGEPSATPPLSTEARERIKRALEGQK